MPQVQSIRRLRRNGESVASIARKTHVSEPTVRKYLAKEDLSAVPSVRKPRASAVGPVSARGRAVARGGSRELAVFCQVGVGRFGVSFSPCERRVSGRFGVGRSCWLLVIALVIA